MSGTKENDYSTGFVNGIADGKPHFNAIKPKWITMLTCVTCATLLHSDSL